MKPQPGIAAPAWALDLLRRVCAAEGVRRPTLLWTEARADAAEAWTNTEIMRVSAPRRETAAGRTLVLHEIAHLTAGLAHGHAEQWSDEHARLVAAYTGDDRDRALPSDRRVRAAVVDRPQRT